MGERVERLQGVLALNDITDSLNKSNSSDSSGSSETDSSETSSSEAGASMEIDEKENSKNSTLNDRSDINVKNLVGTKKKFKFVKKSENFEKREMYRVADISKIFGPDADKFFMKSEDEIKKKVKHMNHATRYYLAVKFYRRNSEDFEMNARIESKFSKKKCCNLLGIVEQSLKSACRKIIKRVRLIEFIRSREYLSPVEFNPQYSKFFFKKYAINYEQLRVGGIFKKKKKN